MKFEIGDIVIKIEGTRSRGRGEIIGYKDSKYCPYYVKWEYGIYGGSIDRTWSNPKYLKIDPIWHREKRLKKLLDSNDR